MTPQDQRQSAILQFLTEQGVASVAALAHEFHVSEMTIRRDLTELEGQRALQRTYGGATVSDPTIFEVSLQAKSTQFVDEKRRIGKAAAELVKDGDIVILDAGSTTMLVAKHLKSKHITVITNALNIAADLSDCPNIDKLFMGVDGIHISGGVMVPDLNEAHTKRAMAKSAQELIVVADHSKIGRSTLGTIVPLAKVTLVITGKEAEGPLLAELRRHVAVTSV